MDFELTEEQKNLIALVKDFAKRETTPKFWDEADQKAPEERFPFISDVTKKFHATGLATLPVPTEYGGGGADLLTQVLVAEAMGRYDPHLGGLCMRNWKLCGDMAVIGNKEQKDEIFTRVMNDPNFFMCEAATEPDSGHDHLIPYDEPGKAIQTYAYRDGDEYVINGEKCFIEGVVKCDVYWIYLRTDKKKPLSQSTSILMVPGNAPGLSVRLNDFMFSIFPGNGDLHFDNVRVPARNLIGEENEAYAFHESRFGAWLMYMGLLVGAGQTMYELAKDHAKTRVQGGKPIFEHLTIGTIIVDMRAQIEKVRLLIYKYAWEFARGEAEGRPVNTLGFNLCNAELHDLEALMAVHLAEVFAGRTGMIGLPIEAYIRKVFTYNHNMGCGSLMRVKAMTQI